MSIITFDNQEIICKLIFFKGLYIKAILKDDTSLDIEIINIDTIQSIK